MRKDKDILEISGVYNDTEELEFTKEIEEEVNRIYRNRGDENVKHR